jgi:hypothetical protein
VRPSEHFETLEKERRMNARTLSICACLGLSLASGAMAGPVATGTGSPFSDGLIPPQALISSYILTQTGTRTIRFVRLQGVLHNNATFAQYAAPRDQVVTLTNDTAGMVPASLATNNLASFPAGGVVNVDVFVRLPTPVTVGTSSWTYTAYSTIDQDPAKYDAEWTSLTVTLNDGAPTIATDLGTLEPGAVSRSATLALHETKWFRFTLPETLNAAIGQYLDIDTEGSTLAGLTNDTEIALYNEDGVRVGYDDDDGTGALSQLTFGGGSRPGPVGAPAYNGRDGATLAAGTYWLAVRGYEASAPNAVGWDFSNTNASIRSGGIKVTVRTNVGQPVGCAADFNRSGGVEVQDIFDYLNSWFAGCP